ncbi:hypothetical protein [Polaromonas sp. A23]|uniref:hypothetical protein n=1 Tax=Polaromonas sp. A23 TaxID=1944133 RepID=UPI0009C7B215|nr:hypothetical protein [Polaromonas sp. A23]OOG37223.1 hypothetical protein B0B52_18915 [Polaromonas sp. A23]
MKHLSCVAAQIGEGAAKVLQKTLKSLFLFVAAIGITGTVAAQPAPVGQEVRPRIVWEVKNRFPLFRSESALPEILKLSAGKPMLEWATQTLASRPDLLEPLTSDYVYSHKGGCKGKSGKQEFKTLWNPCTETYDPELFKLPTSHDIYVQIKPAPPGKCVFKLGSLPGVSADCGVRVVIRVPRTTEPQALVVEGIPGVPSLTENIQVRDILLFAFGDSFASGESNPDVPAIHTNHPTNAPTGEALSGVTWLNSPHELKRKPNWQDRRCHRSVLSWPILAAAKLAADDPHMVVRVASWACTGAEISDGFYSAQLKSGADSLGVPVQRSQFVAAREALCEKKPGGSGNSIDTVEHIKGTKSGMKGAAVGCLKADRTREIDGVLFTFGGNDVFFGPVIFDAVGIVGTHIPFVDWAIKPKRKKMVRTPLQARARIDGIAEVPFYDKLQTRYTALNAGFAALGVPPEKVYQIQYPNPMQDQNGTLCAKSKFDGMDTLEKVQRKANLTKWESENAQTNMIVPLQDAIQPSRNKWNVVDGHVEAMKKHGLCAYDKNKELELAMPKLSSGNWVRNFKPSEYNHYAPTARWFRTPDDVVMGVYSGSSFLPVSGAFHPSAQAHSAIADKVVEHLKKRFTSP